MTQRTILFQRWKFSSSTSAAQVADWLALDTKDEVRFLRDATRSLASTVEDGVETGMRAVRSADSEQQANRPRLRAVFSLDFALQKKTEIKDISQKEGIICFFEVSARCRLKFWKISVGNKENLSRILKEN